MALFRIGLCMFAAWAFMFAVLLAEPALYPWGIGLGTAAFVTWLGENM